MFWLAVAAAGVGFAGYVFLVPYQKMQSVLGTRTAELGAERATVQETTAERDKLKAALAKYGDVEKDKSAAEARRRAEGDNLIAQLRPSLQELGASVVAEDGVLEVSFPSAKVIDTNGIDVSEAGVAALKILAGAVKKAGAKARVMARASAGPPPRDLKTLFHSAGELHAVRAARVLSVLEDAGLAPASVSIIGESEKAARGRGKKAAPGVDRLDIQVEPQ